MNRWSWKFDGSKSCQNQKPNPFLCSPTPPSFILSFIHSRFQQHYLIHFFVLRHLLHSFFHSFTLDSNSIAMNPECLIILALAIAVVLLYFFTDILDPIDPFDDDDGNTNSTAADRSGTSLSSSPSMAPSIQTTLQPVVPTVSPVTSAPTNPKFWVRQAGPFTGSQTGTSFGQSVSFVGDYLVVGEPLAGASGDITLLRRSGNGWVSEDFPFSPSSVAQVSFARKIEAFINENCADLTFRSIL